MDGLFSVLHETALPDAVKAPWARKVEESATWCWSSRLTRRHHWRKAVVVAAAEVDDVDRVLATWYPGGYADAAGNGWWPTDVNQSSIQSIASPLDPPTDRPISSAICNRKNKLNGETLRRVDCFTWMVFSVSASLSPPFRLQLPHRLRR